MLFHKRDTNGNLESQAVAYESGFPLDRCYHYITYIISIATNSAKIKSNVSLLTALTWALPHSFVVPMKRKKLMSSINERNILRARVNWFWISNKCKQMRMRIRWAESRGLWWHLSGTRVIWIRRVLHFARQTVCASVSLQMVDTGCGVVWHKFLHVKTNVLIVNL